MTTAVLGLGIIGSVWARNLQADGMPVRVWNRTPKPDFPGWRASAAEAAQGAECVIIVVADPLAVQQVLGAVTPVLGPGQLVVQASTISPEATRRFAALVIAKGAAFLEAPFTGSKPAAEKRQTVFYCGGPEAAFHQAKPVLERLSRAMMHVGAEIGCASSLKLALNMNVAMIAQSLSESLAFARREGVSDQVFFEALSKNVGHSGLVDLKRPKIETADWSPQFSIKHMDKDLRLALETAGPFSLPQTRACKGVYEAGLARGWGDEDFMALLKLVANGSA